MPLDVAAARQPGYSDPEIVAYLSYTSGEPIEDLPGTDDEKIAALLERRQRKMLPVEDAKPPATAPETLASRPDPSLTFDVPEEAVQPSWMRRFGDLFRGPETMPVMGAPVGSGLGPTAPDIPVAARVPPGVAGHACAS